MLITQRRNIVSKTSTNFICIASTGEKVCDYIRDMNNIISYFRTEAKECSDTEEMENVAAVSFLCFFILYFLEYVLNI